MQAALPCFQLVLVVKEHHIDPGDRTVLQGDSTAGDCPAQGLEPRQPHAQGHPECSPAQFPKIESTGWHRALAKTWGVLCGAEWHQTLPTNVSETSPSDIWHS